MTSKKFQGHEKAAARINYYEDGSFELISYSTVVITVSQDGWLHINGLYSMTTIKHIGWFMKMLGYNYQLAKQLLYDNYDVNLNTGEIRDWDT